MQVACLNNQKNCKAANRESILQGPAKRGSCYCVVNSEGASPAIPPKV